MYRMKQNVPYGVTCDQKEKGKRGRLIVGNLWSNQKIASLSAVTGNPNERSFLDFS